MTIIIDLKNIESTLALEIVLRDTNTQLLGSKDYDEYAKHVQTRWSLDSDTWDLLLEYYENYII